MSHYILIHGAWEESQSWNDVVPFLEENGHTVTLPDLLGHGSNKLEISQITMDGYIETVVNEIKKLDHKVILVGHSMAGAVVSQVAEQIPEKIERLVYVAAFLLKDGQSVFEAMQSDLEGEFLPKITYAEDESYAISSEEIFREVGWHDVSEEAIQRFKPITATNQATAPLMSKVVLSAANFGSVPKTFIRTTIDKMTTPTLQTRMISNWPVEAVYDLESGHFPLFSVPEKLANLLLQTQPVAV